MNFASVIVDVPAKQTDKPFDYEIPAAWKNLIKPGMRVVVPFGPRKVQGFVIDIKEEADYPKTRKIVEVLDLTPSLTPELLEVGHWLTETTLCFKITAFGAMLPAAMKAKYEKEILLVKEEFRDSLSQDVQPYFINSNSFAWSEAEKAGILPNLQKEIEKGLLEVYYKVSQKGNRKTTRYIKAALNQKQLLEAAEEMPAQARKQKELLEFFSETEDAAFTSQELQAAAAASDSTIRSLVKKGFLQEEWVESYRDPYADRRFEQTEPLSLTEEQEGAIKPILQKVEDGQHHVFLMYGVTGSGKTEVYLQSIEAVLQKGKEAIVLVPEIALTPQMVERFKGRFGSLVAVLHSGLSTGEKYDEWRKIQRKEVKLVVGARSAIFAPFENLGMIIIDEEHETSYKQEENPRYHARDAAIFRARKHNCPVVLGSATPTLESFARAKKGNYELLSLQGRVNSRPMPEVSIVDMREELRKGNRTMFSTELLEQLRNRVEKGQQSVLFLNKRGYSSFVMCRDCGYAIQCPHCDISLTYHRSGQQLKCHYCGHEEPMPSVCPECSSEHIRFFGTGTQKVEEELAKVLPEARVIRMDVDTTGRKGAHEKLLSAFGTGEADILLGTQMIAKGLDFPKVTLVGVLAADTMLHLPDFRASEKTFQLLTQVSGRAGRHLLSGEVIIQTYTPEHYSIQLTKQHNYLAFYEQEMQLRKQYAYPPFYYLALVTVSHPDLLGAVSASEKIVSFLQAQLQVSTQILGPAASPIPRINNRYRYQCMIKYKRENNLAAALKAVNERFQQEMQQNGLGISIDLNPYQLM
ncbi:primosomal protein N' [Bacillus lacus]|uniref:Replication restart protein PriA n=1 Tax=Metabacillus lacus TaxID=1983721 RepID=A0A7X2J157_9BACI|nr:primosomal protein N' [Metabacillus lacus]MRX73349.1 primosomal protein N' [Metabacillus lacus]